MFCFRLVGVPAVRQTSPNVVTWTFPFYFLLTHSVGQEFREDLSDYRLESSGDFFNYMSGTWAGMNEGWVHLGLLTWVSWTLCVAYYITEAGSERKPLESRFSKTTGWKLLSFPWPSLGGHIASLLPISTGQCSHKVVQIQGERNFDYIFIGEWQGHIAKEHTGWEYCFAYFGGPIILLIDWMQYFFFSLWGYYN